MRDDIGVVLRSSLDPPALLVYVLGWYKNGKIYRMKRASTLAPVVTANETIATPGAGLGNAM